MIIPCIRKSRGGTSEDDIHLFENEHDIEFPAAYRQFLLQHDGVVFADCIIDLPLSDVAGEYSIQELFGLSHGERFMDDLRSAQSSYEEAVPSNQLVIGCDVGGNLITMEKRHPGSIFWWNHETEKSVLVGFGFEDFLSRIRQY